MNRAESMRLRHGNEARPFLLARTCGWEIRLDVGAPDGP